MSGSGRKTTYRKGVTKRVLYGDPEPKENEQIVRVVALRGSNLFEVANAEGDKSVTMLPTKFRKLIWVKRGDFLIVAEGDGEATVATGKKGAVTSIVEHILYKDQIRNLKSKSLWCVSITHQVVILCLDAHGGGVCVVARIGRRRSTNSDRRRATTRLKTTRMRTRSTPVLYLPRRRLFPATTASRCSTCRSQTCT
jgi:translation initiation factor IF-1